MAKSNPGSLHLGASSSSTNFRAIPSDQTYKFVIAIDFEATCWKDQRRYKQEIIEFPGVLLNLCTTQILSEFHQYVKPTQSPRLSQYCKSLTGITQEQVDTGVLLPKAIELFDIWLKKIISKYQLILPKTSSVNPSGNTALLTWSNFDLTYYLKNECKRKAITRPSYFDQWIDLRTVFKKHYQYKPHGFVDAMKHTGMEFEGRPHSGIDDARNTARLAARVYRDSKTFQITTDITHKYKSPFEKLRN